MHGWSFDDSERQHQFGATRWAAAGRRGGPALSPHAADRQGACCVYNSTDILAIDSPLVPIAVSVVGQEAAMKQLVIGAMILAGVILACSSSAPVGSVVQGPLDTHCSLPDGGTLAQQTETAACHPDGGDVTMVEYGPTEFNAEGDDDDCKYHVKFSSTEIHENQNVTFTAVATRKTDGAPAGGAKTSLEVFLNETHPAPNSNQRSSEGPTGTYQIGPVRFDAPGQWTIRFHLYEECSELLDTSPHGHVAFYISVP